MGPVFIQTNPFWVFAINHSSKQEYFPNKNNHDFLTDLSNSQNNFIVCFVIQNLEKNLTQMVYELKCLSVKMILVFVL